MIGVYLLDSNVNSSTSYAQPCFMKQSVEQLSDWPNCKLQLWEADIYDTINDRIRNWTKIGDNFALMPSENNAVGK